MSNESFNKFMTKVQNDQGLKQELRAAGGGAGMPVEAVVAFAAAKGYDFKVEDVSSELNEKQLDSVAGGVYPKVESYSFLKYEGVKTFLSSAGTLMIKL